MEINPHLFEGEDLCQILRLDVLLKCIHFVCVIVFMCVCVL